MAALRPEERMAYYTRLAAQARLLLNTAAAANVRGRRADALAADLSALDALVANNAPHGAVSDACARILRFVGDMRAATERSFGAPVDAAQNAPPAAREP